MTKVATHPATLLFLYTIGFVLFGYHLWPYILGFVWIMYFCPLNKKLQWVGPMGLVLAAVSSSHLTIPSLIPGVTTQLWPYHNLNLTSAQAVAISLASLALFGLMYFAVFAVFVRSKFLRYPLLTTLLLLALLWILFAVSNGSLLLGAAAMTFLTIMVRVFWVFSYQLSEVDFLKRQPFLSHFGAIFLPWSYIVLRGYSDLANNLSQNEIQLKRSRISGVKLIFWAVVLTYLERLLRDFMLSDGSGVLSPFSVLTGVDFSYQSYLVQGLSRPMAWLFVAFTTFDFILNMAAISHAVISIARICGFTVFRAVYKPLEAQTFGQFILRIYFFYISVLQRFFFYPIWTRLRMVRHKKIRTFLTIYLTIFIGSMVNTIVQVYRLIYDQSQLPSYGDLVARLPYLSLLSLFLGLSVITPQPKLLERSRFIKKFRIKGIIFFLIYSICYSTQFNLPQGHTSPWQNLLYLFGF